MVSIKWIAGKQDWNESHDMSGIVWEQPRYRCTYLGRTSYKTKDLHLFCNLAFLGSNGSHHVMVINSPLIDSWLFTPYSHPQAATRLACGCDQVWKPSQATQETLPILSSSSAEQPAAQSLLISQSGPVLPSTRYITIPMHFRSALKSANASGASYIRLSSA